MLHPPRRRPEFGSRGVRGGGRRPRGLSTCRRRAQPTTGRVGPRPRATGPRRDPGVGAGRRACASSRRACTRAARRRRTYACPLTLRTRTGATARGGQLHARAAERSRRVHADRRSRGPRAAAEAHRTSPRPPTRLIERPRAFAHGLECRAELMLHSTVLNCAPTAARGGRSARHGQAGTRQKRGEGAWASAFRS